MKLEKQVTSLELSKKLKELGVKQESYFYWWDDNTERGKEEIVPHKPKNLKYLKIYSAYTVAELGEMLRKAYKKMGGKVRSFHTSKRMNEIVRKIDSFENEANTRAKMLIYLIENKLI